MNDFEEYIKVNYPRDYERQKRIYPDQSMEGLYSEDYKMWQHQQAKIEKLENELSTTKQVLGNVIDMEVAKVDNLKAQLNNMEACYIEKKKRVDELEGALNEVKEWKSHPVGYETSFGSWGVRDFYRGLAEKALRGGHE
ncbi:hypothetical protein [Acinetobacter lwoffii]|uniref:hypothetical protein n=1 Tax=Acinetobacter lwoffii TaxID=28090 RepID=UPI002DB71EAC|nr:hypothetical protein [Acinetobacter lwoffii]MEB6678247.1 hypothetical protein [Acinetobacter lwoffii]